MWYTYIYTGNALIHTNKSCIWCFWLCVVLKRDWETACQEQNHVRKHHKWPVAKSQHRWARVQSNILSWRPSGNPPLLGEGDWCLSGTQLLSNNPCSSRWPWTHANNSSPIWTQGSGVIKQKGTNNREPSLLDSLHISYNWAIWSLCETPNSESRDCFWLCSLLWGPIFLTRLPHPVLTEEVPSLNATWNTTSGWYPWESCLYLKRHRGEWMSWGRGEVVGINVNIK